MQEILDSLLTLATGPRLETRPDGFWLVAAQIDVVEMARKLAAAEGRLSTVTAIARADGETDLIYHYHLPGSALNIKTRTTGNAMPSITPACPAAAWIEREIHDLYAVEFTGHPNLARLIRPPEMPIGFFRQPGGETARTE